MSAASRTTGTTVAATSSSSRGVDYSPDSLAQRCARGKQAVKVNLAAMNSEQVKLATCLVGVGQGHLFENWAPPGINDDDKQRLLAQLTSLDAGYPGGLRSYTMNARELLLKSKHGVSSLEGYSGEIAAGHTLKAASRAMHETERHGYAVMHQCALVLLAGGLGERLGYSGIKIGLPAEITTGRSYLHYYIDSLLALQSTCDMGQGQLLPLIIMTSPDTHVKTLDLLARNAHFGADPAQITVIMQHEVPALSDMEAHMILNPSDSKRVLTKPHGHGDVHRLLYASGIVHTLQDQGYQWLYFFQVCVSVFVCGYMCIGYISVCMCKCVCMYVNMYVYLHIYIYICTCMYVYMYIYIYRYMHISIHICVYTNVCVIYTSMCLYL